MQSVAKNNLDFIDSSSVVLYEGLQKPVRLAGLYQQTALGLIESLAIGRNRTEFADKLISVVDNAYVLRRWDIVGLIGRVLLSGTWPLRYQSIGCYYVGLSLSRGGCGDLPSANKMLEIAAENAPLRFRARAMAGLGANMKQVGDHASALPLFVNALHIATSEVFDPVTVHNVGQNIAVMKSIEGDNRGALADLQELLTCARLASAQRPQLYSLHMNSLAVELAEVGRLEEARQASAIAVRSPFLSAYPEWRETWNEIQSKMPRNSRSFVPNRSFSLTHQNLVNLREESRSDTDIRSVAADRRCLARVIEFKSFQTKGPAQLSSVTIAPERRPRMTTHEKLRRLVDLISQDETDDETIDLILDAVERIVLSRRPKSIS
jgi:hypothetical protein